MKHKRQWMAALAVIPFALAGCATTSNVNSTTGSDPNDKSTIAFVTHGTGGDPYWDVVKSGAEQAGNDLGVNVSYQADGDPVKQSQLIDAAVATHPDGLVVSMANPDGLEDAVKRAVAAGVPVITIDSGLEQSQAFGALTHVGQSEYIAGQEAGKRLKDSGVKNLICVIHEAGNIGIEDRCRGAANTLGGKVTNVQVDISNIADAGNTIKSQLLADPSIDGVLVLNTGIAVVASQSLDEIGSKATLATFDVSADVLKLIKSEKILFGIDAEPYTQGYLPVVFLTLHKRNGDIVGGGQPVYSGPSFVTKDNADAIAEFAVKGTR